MVVPVGYAQVSILFTGASVPTGAATTFGLDVGVGSPTPNSVATAVDNAFFSSGLPDVISSAVNETGVLVKFGPDNIGPSVLKATNNPGTAAVACPPNVTWLIRKNTALGGRAGRGRMYIPGVPESLVDGAGIIGSGAIADMQTAIDDFFAELATGGFPAVVLHGEDSPLTVPTPITSLTVSETVATQRRRLRR